MNLYAVAMSATKKGESYFVPAHAVAPSAADAKSAALIEAKKFFPESEGFANHVAMVGLIADEHIRAAGWVKRSPRGRKKHD